MILMRKNPLLRPLEGVGSENLDFFGPKWHSLCTLPLQGPKKSIFRAHPFHWPLKWIFLHQNHYVSRHISNSTLIVTKAPLKPKQFLGVGMQCCRLWIWSHYINPLEYGLQHNPTAPSSPHTLYIYSHSTYSHKERVWILRECRWIHPGVNFSRRKWMLWPLPSSMFIPILFLRKFFFKSLVPESKLPSTCLWGALMSDFMFSGVPGGRYSYIYGGHTMIDI
jgi:hypothetical protein